MVVPPSNAFDPRGERGQRHAPERLPPVTSGQVLAARGPKNAVDWRRPYAMLVEDERTARGTVEPAATVFLSNRECPLRCVMCDLWKNTLDVTTPPGAILRQINFALLRLPPADQIKLYNSGNFFDPRAVPPGDLPEIAARLAEFRTVVVESHPRFCGAAPEFAARLAGELEVAIGLETADPATLRWLNKQMTVDDFRAAAERLVERGIHVRTFVLLRPPGMTRSAGIDGALRSLEVAFDAGARCCAVIPTRGGNGIMEHLAADGHFAPPALEDLEQVFAAALRHQFPGRVFVDLWDLRQLSRCPVCFPLREQRLATMNLIQQPLPQIDCSRCPGTSSVA